jgi:hypothetical protein
MRPDLSTVHRLADIAFLGVLGFCAVKAFAHGLEGGYDWNSWEGETTALLARGTVPDDTAMYGYPPGVIVCLIPLAALPPRAVGVAALVGLNIACLLLVGRVVRDCWMLAPPEAVPGGPRPPLWWKCAAAVFALSFLDFYRVIYANQFTLLVLALTVVGLTWVRRNRQIMGGALLGAATLIKPPIGLLMLFCAWKRQWWVPVGWAAAMAALDVVPSVLFFGPVPAIEEHVRWVQRAARQGHRVDIEHPMFHGSNQSLAAGITRLLRAPPSTREHWVIRGTESPRTEAEAERRVAAGELSLTRLPLPPEGPCGEHYHVRVHKTGRWPRLNVADWEADSVRPVWAAASLCLLALLLWSTRGPPAADDRRWWAECSVWLLATFWFSPLAYDKMWLWAYPAMALLCSAVWERPAGLSRRDLLLGYAAIAAWSAGQVVDQIAWAKYYAGVQWLSLVTAYAVAKLHPRTADGPGGRAAGT